MAASSLRPPLHPGARTNGIGFRRRAADLCTSAPLMLAQLADCQENSRPRLADGPDVRPRRYCSAKTRAGSRLVCSPMRAVLVIVGALSLAACAPLGHGVTDNLPPTAEPIEDGWPDDAYSDPDGEELQGCLFGNCNLNPDSLGESSAEREPCNFLTGEGGCGSDEPEEACLIKGNIAYLTGQRIYHLPGQEFYDETVINSSEGEQWFCTEAEAIAAGWRLSYR